MSVGPLILVILQLLPAVQVYVLVFKILPDLIRFRLVKKLLQEPVPLLLVIDQAVDLELILL